MQPKDRWGLGRTGLALALAGLSFTFATTLAAQTQTGQIAGTVESADRASLPGVTVTVSSPALQGTRVAVTDADGQYTIPGLPPGTYTVEFGLSGFATVRRTATVPLGGLARVDAGLAVASVEETITVTADAGSALATPSVATALRYAETVDKLATGRTLANIADLAPGLTDNGPNAGQVTINGAFAYDNVFLLNGVDINDNLFGNAHNLYIEDALQEVTVHSSGISAEYGRFSGGVISAVTKSGGNAFQGSFRTDLTNPSWRDETLVQQRTIDAGTGRPNQDQTNRVFSATLGGPVAKDRLWFFGAYRRENLTEDRVLNITNSNYVFGTENRRYEGKLTGRLAANHTVQANFIKTENTNTNNPSINSTFSIDERTLVDRQSPSDLWVGRYDGILAPNVFVEAQYSRKAFGFRNAGNDSTDIFDSPFLAVGRAGIPRNSHYNAPYFDDTDPEDRNNNQISAALSYFLSTGGAGRHDVKAGFERYTSYRTGGNSQSSTDYDFYVDPVVVNGVVQRDAQGRIVPNFVPGVSEIENWRPVRGARVNLRTLSFYVNDRWRLGDRVTLNLGARAERHSSEASQAQIESIGSSALVPRLGATFDVKGDSRLVLGATYGHYAGKASENQFGDNTNVGNPNALFGVYRGPAGQGVDFAPGFDPRNYEIYGGDFPVQNVVLDEDLKTPITKEWTLSAGTRLGSRGELKAAYVHRRTADFIEDFYTLDGGRTTLTDGGQTFGTFDNRTVRNSDLPVRRFQGLQFTGSYRVTSDWALGANWSVQLQNEANFEGEEQNNPGASSIIGDYPEILDEARHFPTGRTDDYQRHKARIWSVYDLGLGRAGSLTLGALYRYDSPLTFSFQTNGVPLTPVQSSLGAGYASLPSSNVTLYYEGRGTGEFEPSHLFDFSLSYEVPLYKTARPFVKVEARNAFNAQPLVAFNTTVSPVLRTAGNPNAPVDALGLPTTYTRGPLFGTATANSHTPIPREFLVSVGFRF